MSEALTVSEQDEHEADVAIVAAGIATVIEVGAAMQRIRERKSYRATHPTFEAFCADMWSIGASRARQLIGAANVAENLKSVTKVTVSERLTRPLAGLDPAEQRAAWQEAEKTAPEGKVTAKHVANVVKGRSEPVETPQIAPAPPSDDWTTYLAALDALPKPPIGISPTRLTPQGYDLLHAHRIYWNAQHVPPVKAVPFSRR